MGTSEREARTESCSATRIEATGQRNALPCVGNIIQRRKKHENTGDSVSGSSGQRRTEKGARWAAKTPEGHTEWVKAQGCEATAEEMGAFLKEKQAKTGELSDDELESAAGGGCNAGEVALSVYSALMCAVDAIVSAIDDEYKRGKITRCSAPT